MKHMKNCSFDEKFSTPNKTVNLFNIKYKLKKESEEEKERVVNQLLPEITTTNFKQLNKTRYKTQPSSANHKFTKET